MWRLLSVLLTVWASCVHGQVKSCDFPKIRHGGLYNESRYRLHFPVPIGKEFTYYCDRDFVAPSQSHWDYITCTKRGWEPEVPCLRKCVFDYLENGKYEYIARVYKQGESIKPECNPGLSLPSGGSIMTCTEDGWSPPPICMRIQTCFTLRVKIRNGYFSEGILKYPLNTQAQYNCGPGYVTANGEKSGLITCLQKGWSAQPTCIKSCDRPILENAITKRKETLFKLDDQLQFECKPGYVNREGKTNGSIVCEHNGWSDRPACFEKCGRPPAIDNGKITSRPLEGYYQGSLVEYQCLPNYKLEGKKTIQCLNGQWSTPPKCLEVTCPHPYIVNGVYRPEKTIYRVEDLITYECKNKFSPATQNTTIKCTNTGWLPSPRCTLKTCDFPIIRHGGLYDERRYRSYFPALIGKVFPYYCASDFVTPSKSFGGYIRCTQTGWEPSVPCRRKCIFNYLENGNSGRTAKTYYQEESVIPDCHLGFSLPNGETVMTCTENGWSPPPRCVRIQTCSQADIEIKNGFFSENTFKYALNKQAQYNCNPGYVTANGETSGSITCQQNGWSARPTCIKTCNRPVLENAITKRNETRFKLDDQLQFECKPGYENIEGKTNGSIVCEHNGWSNRPACFEKCGPPPGIDNGDITSMPVKRYSPGSLVEYQCQSYYKLEGKKTIQCLDGQWSAPPKCLDPCVLSEDIMNKHNVQLRLTDGRDIYVQSGELIQFKCKSGYNKDSPPESFQVKCTEGNLKYPTCR